jgi:DNA-binding transcriptional LysR family regulator
MTASFRHDVMMKMLSTTRFMHAHLKTRHILLLVELGRRRSIMQAAEAACMNQPAASRLLSDLEYALGLRLFDRNARGIIPNTFGEVMIRRASAALAEMEAALQEIMELSAGVTGRVVLGSVSTPAASMVPDAVRLLKARFPRLEVAIHVDASKPLLRQLRSGKLDLMIGRVSDNDTPEELAFDPLTYEPHCLVVRAGHPLAERTQLTLGDVADQCWLMPPTGSVLRDRLIALFRREGQVLPGETVETQDLPVLTSLLANSDMVAPLPLEPMRTWLDSGLLAVLPIELDLRMDMYGIVTRRNHQPSPATQAMLEALRQVMVS